MTTIADLVIDAIRACEIDTLYCIPGVQNDDFFDRLVDARDIRPVVCRHEQATAYMALGASQITGRPAACCVVPGPGMLNASAALNTAFWAGGSVLAIVGEIATHLMDKNIGALHQMPDQHAVLQQLTKHAELIVDPANAAGQIQAAIDALVSGAPHPVSIEVPVNRWAKPSDGDIVRPVRQTPTIDDAAVAAAAAAVAGATNPLIVVGSGAVAAGDQVIALAELLGCPVTTRRMGHGVVPTDHQLFVPITVAHGLWADVDVVVGIGSRVEWPLDTWGIDDDLTVVQIDIDPEGLDRHRIGEPGVIGVLGDAAEAVAAITDAVRTLGVSAPDRAPEIAELKASFQTKLNDTIAPQVEYLRAIHDVLPADGVLMEDVTQLGFAAHLAYSFNQPRTFLSSGAAGNLGAGVPMGIGAADAARHQTVLTISGDGGFMFGAAELATAVQHDIPTKILLFDDGAFGNVKRIQTERFGADRTIASTLRNPDFVALAESFGVRAWQANDPAEVRSALEGAFEHDGPALVHVPVGPFPNPWPLLRLPAVRGQRVGV